MGERKDIRMVWTLLVAVGVLALSGCGGMEHAKEEPVEQASNQTGEASGITVEGKKDTYHFVDVYGEQYEAELLSDVPKCTYEMDRIVKENGYKYYTDEEGNKISRLGIDVSEFQPQVDWQQVKESGIEYVMVRLGYRGYGESGTLVEDAMFRQHMEGARAAGLDVGVYFFSQAVNEQEVLEEAQFVLERLEGYEIACPVVFDTEEIKFDTARTDNLSSEEFTDHCILFCDKVKEAGYDTMIYANMKWMAFTLDLTRLTEYEKWYADYEPLPQCPYDYAMWQYTETGSVPGIEGNVDINVWFP